MAEAKHSFVDDNPYLVYSPKAEMTYDGNSGGGGGDGFPVIEIDDNNALSVTAGELDNMLKTSPVMLDFGSKGDVNWIFIVYLSFNEDTGYVFEAYNIHSNVLVGFVATTKDAYPVLSS